MNRKLKAELINLFGRLTVERAIELYNDIKKCIDNDIIIRVSKEIAEISSQRKKIEYFQTLDIDTKQALILTILFP